MKNVIIVLLLLVIGVEGYFLSVKKTAVVPSVRPSGNMPPKPQLITKGLNLTTSSMMQYAYKIAPGDIPAASQKVLTGFSVKSQSMADGSVQVSLIPKDSDDQFQQYIVKPGNTLYFIEMTPADDNVDSDKDLNYRDDYGIIVDANGIVQ
jgi:hypothetical protein